MEKNKITYQQAIEEIEDILSQIENDEMDVDELSAKLKRAAELLKTCKSRLKTTEEEVENIIKEIED